MSSTIISFGDIVEDNGKTIRENNMELPFVHQLGALVGVDVEIYHTDQAGMEVSLKGHCSLYVIEHIRDCDGTPLYELSDLPIARSKDTYSTSEMLRRSTSKINYRVSGGALAPTKIVHRLFRNFHEWLNHE